MLEYGNKVLEHTVRLFLRTAVMAYFNPYTAGGLFGKYKMMQKP